MPGDWLEAIDKKGATPAAPARNLSGIERHRMDYLSKLIQHLGAEIDLAIAEAYEKYGKVEGKLRDGDLEPTEQAAISKLKNGLALSNARMKMLLVKMRRDCSVPFHAQLRGFTWYDESSGRAVPIVPETPVAAPQDAQDASD